MVQIITDTTACLPSDYIEAHHIPVIPQIVTFGEESYYEGVEIDNATFMKRLRNSTQLPKTAAPPPELFRAEFERLMPLGEPILCVHPSAEVSGTVRSAIVAAQDFPDADIRVIDTQVVAAPLATLVQMSVEWAEAGHDIATIEAQLREAIARTRIYFLVATLDYLARGGRIGGASALLGSVLQIKPILTMQSGQVTPYEKERTHKRAVARLKEITLEQIRKSGNSYLTVMHADVSDQATELANEFCQLLSLSHIPIYDLPPAIVVHGGPGILGVSFFSDK
jgi:fatty acid kinase fatty acid binding subunit